MTWWKVACTACAAVGAVCVCVATAGTATPLVASTVIGWGAGAGALGYLVGDKADKEAAEREKHLMEDKRYRDALEQVKKQVDQNTQSQDLINTIVGKINGTIARQPHETDDYLRNQLTVAQNNLRSGEARLDHLHRELGKLRNQLGGNQSLATLLGLDKLSFTDKVMVTGAIVLVIFLLKR